MAFPLEAFTLFGPLTQFARSHWTVNVCLYTNTSLINSSLVQNKTKITRSLSYKHTDTTTNIVSFSSPMQKTAGETTIVTPAALPSILTPLTSWCPEFSAQPFPFSAAYTPCPSRPAPAAHLTNCAWTDTPKRRIPCTTIPTSIQPPMNIIWELKPDRLRTPHRALEATVTTPIWTQPQPTCILRQARLIMTTDLDNDSSSNWEPQGEKYTRTFVSQTVRRFGLGTSSEVATADRKRNCHIYWRDKTSLWNIRMSPVDPMLALACLRFRSEAMAQV